MVDHSHSHFRSFLRLLSRHALLHTEMLSTQAVIHQHPRLLPFEHIQHPIVLQLGGSSP
jgi:tRNA-dihydrouridine synthase A